MRLGENDPRIDFSFDCGPGAFKRAEAQGLQHLRLESYSANVPKTVAGLVSIPPGLNALCINYKGTLITRSGSQGKLVLVPPRSMTFIRGPLRLVVQAARGDHLSQVLTWQGAMTPLLDHWMVTRTGSRSPQALSGKEPPRQIGCKPIDPHFNDALARFEEAKKGAVEYAEPLMLSVVYEIAARLMTGLDEVQLAAIPATLPDTIRELTVRVRSNPALPWPLKDAADAAGYSPFHFSRVFKSLVGYGFHEYVDRCRTECAVEMLCITENAVDIVASSCGFGTTQGLRESVKEYLGLVPSELRSVPDTIDLAAD